MKCIHVYLDDEQELEDLANMYMRCAKCHELVYQGLEHAYDDDYIMSLVKKSEDERT